MSKLLDAWGRQFTLILAALMVVISGLLLSACSRGEKVTMEQLEVRSEEIGALLLDSISDIETNDPPGFGLHEDDESPDFFGRRSSSRWWVGSIVTSLAPEESATTLETALLMTKALEGDGWSDVIGQGQRYFYYEKVDELGCWTVLISYTTEPPPEAQRIMVDVTSPHTS